MAIEPIRIVVRDSLQHGRGVFALIAIKAGERIITFTGARLHRTEVDFESYHLQIAPEWYLGASGQADDYMNHSCAPNGGFAGGLDLVALRDIAAGEEITWDYGTAIDEADFAGFPCACGAPECRGVVRSFRHLAPAVQQRLRPHLLPYLAEQYYPVRRD